MSMTTSGYPYTDRSLPISQRVADLTERLPLADKAGLMFHTMVTVGRDGGVADSDQRFGLPSLQTMVTKRRMNHFNLLGAAATVRELAQWHNAAQQLAAGTGLGIPITFSTDPRHAFTDNPGTAMMSGLFSQWPEPLGLAAIGDPATVERFADIARQEYVAVGLRVALHPQIDLATEPRWSRISGTFGEDADLTARLVVAYLRGFQGAELGTTSVAAMVKHFPGGGPQLDGEDPHFEYGREQVYPAGRFDHHLAPFRAAIEAGGSQIMPYYGMPVGTEYEEVGFAFSQQIISGLLRDQLGFQGIVCTDWGLLTDVEVLGQWMPARAWGVEELSREERAIKIIEAGVDQFGGEACPQLIIDLVKAGRVPERRIDESVRRLLTEKFVLGLFDDARYVDAVAAGEIVGRSDFRAAGEQAQRDAMTLVTNTEPSGEPTLPAPLALRLYLEGIDPSAAAAFGTVVDDPAEADLALVRLRTPYEPRTSGFEAMFHAGSLTFPDAERDRIVALCDAMPTVIDIYLERPAVFPEIIDAAAAVLADFGASDEAVLDVIFGGSEPKGRLPFDLPRSMAAVEASAADAPFDTKDPIFRFGHGLGYR
ncbi:glycoside hydrolase family 3 protein [Microlunatus sp. GCM10028923]|uniref:glycoside hydrolase family 3 protein n=1 Tax=Microlunatus sp. GCM10028923 TaxID=3273400 RepID=UPI0036098F7C